jgi:hypothetical protein|tara:strand:+ start:762 stop:938 length:177 start_codon:yes stop_codon:yes gene_type:complete
MSSELAEEIFAGVGAGVSNEIDKRTEGSIFWTVVLKVVFYGVPLGLLIYYTNDAYGWF